MGGGVQTERDLAARLDVLEEHVKTLYGEGCRLREVIEGEDVNAAVHSLEAKVNRIFECLEHATPPFD